MDTLLLYTAIHGTRKISIYGLNLARDNADKIIAARDQFGFGSLDLQSEDFIEPDKIIQLGYPPNRIDLITSLPGVDFNQCFSQRVEIEIDGVQVNFIDLENLKENKRASNRAQDLADLENLE